MSGPATSEPATWRLLWLQGPLSGQDVRAWQHAAADQIGQWLAAASPSPADEQVTLGVYGKDEAGEVTCRLFPPAENDSLRFQAWRTFTESWPTWRTAWLESAPPHSVPAAEGLALLVAVLGRWLAWQSAPGPLAVCHFAAMDSSADLSFWERSLRLWVVENSSLVLTHVNPDQVLSTPLPGPPATRPHETPVALDIQAYWTAKQGNASEEWEDGFALMPDEGRAAIADGASAGIFVKPWAAILAERFVGACPDLADRDQTSAWLARCRDQWLTEIHYGELRYHQKIKVDRVGGAAALLTLQVWQCGPEPNQLRWQSYAVGDCCLLWWRAGRILASFPIVHSRQFNLGPALLLTRIDAQQPTPLMAQGICESGDVFLLATDAVAQFLLRRVEQGDSDLDREMLALTPSTWLDRLDELRREEKIVNDDATLLVIRVPNSRNSVEFAWAL